MNKSNNPLISIVVPVYNVEKYLDRCIKSILNQTYHNLEIILVDDGSTDNSGKMCDEYKKQDSRIIVVHQKNQGLSGARNTGIKKSRGTYIGFVDSDDYIEPYMYEELYRCCSEHDAEISCINKTRETPDGKTYTDRVSNTEKVVSNKEALLLLLCYDPSVWDKLYRKDLFKDISFPLGKLYEDIVTTPKLLMRAKRICYSKKIGYHYIQNNDGITRARFSKNKMDYLNHTKWLLDFTKKMAPEYLEAAERFHILSLTIMITECYNERNKFHNEYATLLNELKKYDKKYQKNPYISKAKKIMIWMDLHGMVGLANFIKGIREKNKYK